MSQSCCLLETGKLNHRSRVPFAVFLGSIAILANFTSDLRSQSIARSWNEQLLNAIRSDTARPTVHARNLFHTSAAMFDAWAAFDPLAVGTFHHEKLSVADPVSARNEAVSFAAYRVLSHRFAASPGAAVTLASLNHHFSALGYDANFTSTIGDHPAALGNRIAQSVIAAGLVDGSNELGNYANNIGYSSVNPPLVVASSGTSMNDPNRWQPLTIGAQTQNFLTPQWGQIQSFAISRPDPSIPFFNAPPPPMLGGATDAQFKSEFQDVIRYSSYLSPDDGVMMDISPGAMGNNPLGSNAGTGHAVNPATGQPYAPQLVNRGDFGRVSAEFWADGPLSETPPGHWNTIFNQVSDSPFLDKRIGGVGSLVDNLEWDVKGYLALNGAVHDAAIAAWDVKRHYDGVRPISAIRCMAGFGQSSDPLAPSYHPNGLLLEPGLVEVITNSTTAPGQHHESLAGNEGRIAVKSWLGHPQDADNDYGGVGWILAEDWIPYQADFFVTPPFAGYVSGHSTFSRSAAEVLAAFTGSEFFPGGAFEYSFLANDYLTFENGPSQAITLTYATYFDAADAAGQSRLWGGIHIDADDFIGRLMGAEVGRLAYGRASFFYGVPEPTSASLVLGAFFYFVYSFRRRTATPLVRRGS